MILHINNSEYDYHTLVKVAEMAGLAGIVGFHESEDGYMVSFPDTENTQTLITHRCKTINTVDSLLDSVDRKSEGK